MFSFEGLPSFICSWVQSSESHELELQGGTNWCHVSLDWNQKRGDADLDLNPCHPLIVFGLVVVVFELLNLEGRQLGDKSAASVVCAPAKHNLATMPDWGSNECTWEGQNLRKNKRAREKPRTCSVRNRISGDIFLFPDTPQNTSNMKNSQIMLKILNRCFWMPQQIYAKKHITCGQTSWQKFNQSFQPH